MDTTDFERLWPKRAQLSPEQAKKLEDAQKSDTYCRDFANGGDQVHLVLRRFEAKAPTSELSYRMRVYAHNNQKAGISLFERGGVRWASLAVGLFMGATLITFSLDSLPVGQQATRASLVNADSISRNSVIVDVDESMSVDKTRLISQVDSIGPATDREQKVTKIIPESAMKMQMVSGTSGVELIP